MLLCWHLGLGLLGAYSTETVISIQTGLCKQAALRHRYADLASAAAGHRTKWRTSFFTRMNDGGGRPSGATRLGDHKDLVAWAFGCLLRLGHPLRHFRFHGVKVEARATLHRREIEEGLNLLAHYLLDKHEAPELVFEPIEILLRPVFRPVAGPARALERIKAQVGDVRHVRMRLFT